jgi:hypothetical protein
MVGRVVTCLVLAGLLFAPVGRSSFSHALSPPGLISGAGCIRPAVAARYESTHLPGDGFEVLGLGRTVTQARRYRDAIRRHHVFTSLRAWFGEGSRPGRLLLRHSGARTPLPIYVAGSRRDSTGPGVTGSFCNRAGRPVAGSPTVIVVAPDLGRSGIYGDITLSVLSHEMAHAFEWGAAGKQLPPDWYQEMVATAMDHFFQYVRRRDEANASAVFAHPEGRLDVFRRDNGDELAGHPYGLWEFAEDDLGGAYMATFASGSSNVRRLVQAMVKGFRQVLRVDARTGDATGALISQLDGPPFDPAFGFRDLFANFWVRHAGGLIDDDATHVWRNVALGQTIALRRGETTSFDLAAGPLAASRSVHVTREANVDRVYARVTVDGVPSAAGTSDLDAWNDPGNPANAAAVDGRVWGRHGDALNGSRPPRHRGVWLSTNDVYYLLSNASRMDGSTAHVELMSCTRRYDPNDLPDPCPPPY